MERRLIDYLPPFIQRFKEMSEIMETEQKEFESAWVNAENALADQAVITATINGIKRWEKIFGITAKATETLEERRFRIISKLNERPPYTYEALKNFLTVLLGENGYTLYLNADKYELTVKLATANNTNYATVVELLEKILPANLERVTSMYNTYQILTGYTHGQLAQYTHDELRKDVLA
jgi:uncharacterized protein YmfQ (DUF2313 family)